jgi:SAM-dependent methyltransferase
VLNKDADYFQELQTRTGWGRTLQSFAEWCTPQPDWLTLDVGCGPGMLPGIFARFGCKAVGVDLDMEMFRPSRLHPLVAQADVNELPFNSATFDLITATNLLFLHPEPIFALTEMKRLLHKGGRVAMLNPSERLNIQAAIDFAEERGLEGVARDTLINWAKRAEGNFRWTEDETRILYEKIGMKFERNFLKMGPGFARFSLGIA